MRRPHDLPIAALLAAAAALPGCDGCHGSKPYTPYTLSDPPSASAAEAGAGTVTGGAGSLPDGGPAFAAVAATAAPGDGKHWPLEGGAVEPPAGHAFAVGLVLDADGDGKPDLLAWSRAQDGLRGELWFASGKDPASGRALIALPGDLAVPGCAPSVSLTRIGPGAVALDFDPRCSARVRDRGARWVAVFRLASGGPPELGLELRLGAPAEGESLAVALDGRDRDGDGRGDLTATLTLSGAPHPLPAGGEAKATLAFFDRPTGLSRDPSEPEASLKALAVGLVSDGRKKTTAPHVAAAAMAARRLHALLCEEAGKPVVTTSAGPVHCGDVHLLEDAAMAEAEAALNLGDPLAALAAMGRIEGRRKDLDALFAKSVPSVAGKLVRTTAAAPDVAPPPAFGPIAFDGGGDLLVRAREHVLRVDRASFAESPIDAAVKWPTRLAWGPSPDAPAWTLAAVEERCDSPTLVARFEAGGGTIDVALPILTPARCAAARVPVDLLGPSAQGDLVSIRGDVVAFSREASPHAAIAEGLAAAPGAAVPLGAARSPDGAVVAISTPRGVLVAQIKGQGRSAAATLWTTPALDGATACAPSNAADRIACAVKGAVAIYDAR
jgi:hypothetical protein